MTEAARMSLTYSLSRALFAVFLIASLVSGLAAWMLPGGAEIAGKVINTVGAMSLVTIAVVAVIEILG